MFKAILKMFSVEYWVLLGMLTLASHVGLAIAIVNKSWTIAGCTVLLSLIVYSIYVAIRNKMKPLWTLSKSFKENVEEGL